MEDTLDIDRCEICECLVLVLIAQPCRGWEAQFAEITAREIQRLAVPAGKSERDE
jgi:hypothetical protein